MALIAPITTTPTLQVPALPAAKTPLGADFNMFLKLLTTQMQNQDPLSPMDSTQYTQQLATYSQVEQTVQQTSTLKDILGRLSTQDISQAAGFIGKDAVFASAVSGLGAKPASWNYTTDRTLAAGTATITNAAGATVLTRALTAADSAGRVSWDGTLADGSRAPDGAYTLAITGVDAAGGSMAATITCSGTINGVSARNGVVSLGVNGVPMTIGSLVSLAAAAV